MIKLNPIETLPENPQKMVLIFMTIKGGWTFYKEVSPEDRIEKTDTAITVWGDYTILLQRSISLDSLHGWLYRDDLFAQLIPAHNVGIEGAKIKNVEVVE